MDKTHKKLFSIILLILILLVGFDIYLLVRKPAEPTTKISYINNNSNQKIKAIESYLDSISFYYIADEQTLATRDNLPSWGCGPSNYALATILNKKFFDNGLIIDASYNNKNPYEIIERFGLAKSGENVVDHAWLEIYFNDKFLFVDPTIGQFGKVNKIAYQVFDIGQANISDILKQQYGIEDVRLSLLVPKVINRIPIDQEPYPGMTIAPKSIGYFLKVLEDRNTLNDGKQPEEWTNWVSFLTEKYLNPSNKILN